MNAVRRITAPWRTPARLWRQGCYVSLGLPIAIFEFVVSITLLSISAGLLITFVLAVPFVFALFATNRWFARGERSRARALLDVDIEDTMPPLAGATFFARLGERARSKRRWKEIAHSLASILTGTVGYALVAAAWGGSLALIALPLYQGALPNDRAEFWLFTSGDFGSALLLALIGVVGVVLAAPWLTAAVAEAQVSMARSLLGGGREEQLAAEVGRLETSRAAAVDTAETERRRIERDLHDGAQQRLVALAANLGAARDKLDSDPDASRALVVDAHEEAKAALAEIRDLVRGIHPVILGDRGLDAALSAVIARSPVPVTLETSIARRPPAAIESAAYFIVTECLTNVARHANATKVAIGITRVGDRLVMEIHDDGVGGADASRGSGLQGLRDRVIALGGTMYVISPVGGPTTISVELPCGS